MRGALLRHQTSSIGIAERRLDGTAIPASPCSLNFTQDPPRLPRHAGLLADQAALFDWPGLQAAVIQADDPRAGELVAKAQARGLDTWTVAAGAMHACAPPTSATPTRACNGWCEGA